MISPFRSLWSILLLFVPFAPIFGQCDLSLQVTLSNPTTAVYQNVTYHIQVSNSGPDTARAIVINAPADALTASYGLVLTGSSTTKGNWNLLNNIWEIPKLAPGQSALLNLELFTMKPGLPPFFASIEAAIPHDIDSTPGNTIKGEVNEDDEALYVIASPSSCDFTMDFIEVACIPEADPNLGAEYRYQLQVNTTDPNIQFFQISSNASFAGNFIIEANKPYSPPLGQGWYSLFESQHSAAYFFRPYNSQGCTLSDTLKIPVSCTNSEPPPVSPCILNYWYPAIYCINDGLNYALNLKLSDEVIFNSALHYTDNYRLLLDGVVVTTAQVQDNVYLGLTGNMLAMTSDPVEFKLERISDNRCIAQGSFIPSDFCPVQFQAFCPQQGIYPWEEWISRVQFTNLVRSSGKSQISNYSFTNLSLVNNSAFVEAGDSVPFSIEVGYSWTAFQDYVSIWLDINRDGYFDADESIFEGQVPAVASGPNVHATLSGKAFIPNSAVNGLANMKVVLRRGAPATVCGTVPYGEVEVYPVSINNANSGTNNCTGTELTILDIVCSDNGTPSLSGDDTYKVIYRVDRPGHDGEPVYAGGFWVDAQGGYQGIQQPFGFQNQGIVGEINEFGPISIAQNPQFNFRAQGGICQTDYVYIEAPSTCSSGPDPVPTPQCGAQSLFPWEDWISGVKVGSFNKASGKSPFSNFTLDTIPLTKGVHPVTVRCAFSYLTFDEYVRIWIDFNHDGVFGQNEIAYSGILSKPSDAVPFKDLNGILTIPTQAMTGATSMRVRMSRGEYALACDDQGFGEVEDYTVNIVNNLGKLQHSDPSQSLPITINEARLFPNPATDFVQIRFNSAETAQINLIDQMGRTILEANHSANQQFETIDLTSVQNGLYFIQIATQGKRTEVQKLVVARLY